jgi:uncharacterized membrane protein
MFLGRLYPMLILVRFNPYRFRIRDCLVSTTIKGVGLNLEKVISGFFIILALTMNFGFFYGDPTVLEEHSRYELFAAIIINLIATIYKLGDKTQLGAVLLATSLVADIQLIGAASIWALGEYVVGMNTEVTVAIISFSGGALLANIVSVILFTGDVLKSKR